MSESPLCIIITTTPDKPTAEKIAAHLLKNKLAACIQILGPIESHYVWNNTREVSAEYQCHIKTQKNRYTEIENAIQTHHPYEVPEIICVPISEISPAYAHWVYNNTSQTPHTLPD